MLFRKNKKDDNRKFTIGNNDTDWDVNSQKQEVRTIVKVKTRDRGNKLKNNSNKVFTVMVIMVVVLFIIFFSYIEYRKSTVGVRAVMDMYNFNNISQLAEQQNDLQNICTPAVFDFNTVENAKVALNTYLKFKGDPVKVNIISKGDGYVLFSLVSPYIYSNKRFVMLYKVNWLGQIDWMRQEVAEDMFNYQGTPWN